MDPTWGKISASTQSYASENTGNNESNNSEGRNAAHFRTAKGTEGNICTRIMQREIGGRKHLYRLDQVSVEVVSKSVPDVDPLTIETLFSMALMQTNQCKEILPSLSAKLKVITNAAMKSANQEVAKLFISFELVEVLLDVLVLELFELRKLHETDQVSNREMLKCNPNYVETARLMMQLIYECIQMVPGYRMEHLRKKHRVLEVLFSLFGENNNHIHAFTTWVLEEIIVASTATAPVILNEIIGLPGLMAKLTGNQLFHFYHLISTLMSDVEFTASAHSSLEKHDQWLVNSTVNVSDINQKFLLSVPLFLEKMCTTLCQPMMHNFNRRRQVDFVTQFLTATLGLNNPDVNELLEQNMGGGGDNVFFQMTLFQEKTTRADLFLIVSLLLSGNSRDQVQTRLVDFQFMPKLHRVFKSIVWENPIQEHIHSEHHNMAGHEDCNPNTVIRIQFLRLIHSVADSHANRYYLLSSPEVKQLKALAVQKGLEVPKDLKDFDTTNLSHANIGILSEIVSLLKEESSSSCVRFWITRAMEAFLRGETQEIDQTFLLEKNLVEDTVELLVSSQPRVDTVAQGNFDFLSAIMRKNLSAFERCDRVLDCSAKFHRLIAAIDYSLVDSNMFIRCVMLTACEIRNTRPEYLHVLESSRLLNHFSKMQVCVEVAARMLSLLTVSTLSQENVSCLNTSLLVFIMANRIGELPKYLKAFSESSDGSEILCNFIELLEFWQVHYTLPMKKTDCRSLEMSSGVKFVEWMEVVKMLLNSDTTSPTSISHYLSPPQVHKFNNHPSMQPFRTS
uniref:Short transient receptor potential channel 4-associated protein-like n=1 Tax=Phallusia mammillata TaxID=59560 RepID=A0A6F9DVT1_9ASCI|nr:short transient receptor potential channel 4-associated protein-like [Phallusia mammillata]